MEDKKYLTEHVPPMTPLTAIEEASRCLLCHDAPCSQDCPAGTNPAKFIRSMRLRNFKGAVETIRTANILGGVCARVCPYNKLCESACSRTGIDKPIQIGRLQRYLTDFETSTGMEVLEAPEVTKEKIAVIGSGPAGLAAATKLALDGYDVTIYEEKSIPGGVLSYGITPSRLPQDVVDQEINYVKNLGVNFVLDCKVGTDISFDDLKEKGFAAFVLSIGLQNSRSLDIPGSNLEGVTNAVEFLANARSNNGNIKMGENVIIIGGGDVAMDCAATAKLLGAKKVTVLYRRRYEDMPANKDEVRYINEIGVNFAYTFKPHEILESNGKVSGIKAFGSDDESEILLKADTVVFSIGQVAENANDLAGVSILLNGKNLILVGEENFKTNVEGIFAAGDAVNGGITVVQAVAEGKIVAESVDKYLTSLREIGKSSTEVAVENEEVK